MPTWTDAEDQEIIGHAPGTRRVKTRARIRCNATGEIHEGDDAAILVLGADAPSDFIWSDGNFACDCNRKILWGRYADVEYEDEETPCGDGAYSVQLINPADGSVWYDEFE